MKKETQIKEVENYVAFDIETTGLCAEYDEIIEIGAIKVKDGKVVDKFNMLVKPKCKITKRITNINGITNEMVENCESIEEVLPKFIKFTEKLPLVAHNIEFDYSFINENYKRIKGKDFRRKKICTLKLMKKYVKDVNEYGEVYYRGLKLSDCVEEFFGYEEWKKFYYNSHRALIDAEMVSRIYEEELWLYR